MVYVVIRGAAAGARRTARASNTGQIRCEITTLSPSRSLARSKAATVAARSFGSTVSTWEAPSARTTASMSTVRRTSPSSTGAPGRSWNPVIAVTSLSMITATMFTFSLTALSSAGIPEWKKVESPRKPSVRRPVVRATPAARVNPAPIDSNASPARSGGATPSE